MGGGGQPKPSRDTYKEYIKKHKLSEEEPREWMETRTEIVEDAWKEKGGG